MYRVALLIVFLMLLTAVGAAQALPLPICEGPDLSTCALSDEILANYRWPAVTPLKIDDNLLADRDYRRVSGILPIYKEPFGELIETTGEGYSFVTVSKIEEDWAEIGEEQWVPADVLSEEIEVSRYAGVELPQDGLEYPMAWTLRHLRAATEPGGPDSPINPFLYRYTRVTIFSCVRIEDKCWYQIGKDQWVHQYKLAMFKPVEQPEDVNTEKWIGIDLYEQVLTAYEGATPVFTTLISSGLPDWSTREGVFNVWLRRQRGDMSGAFQLPDFYSLQEVPWTQYFDGGIALHGAYWHDGFGFRRSHGCVNASLTDANWLYTWSNDFWDWEEGHGIAVYVYTTGDYESD